MRACSFVKFSTNSSVFLNTFHLRIAVPSFKGALSGLGQFLTTESSLKVMKNVFYFISEALFVLKTFKFLSLLFGHVKKRLD